MATLPAEHNGATVGLGRIAEVRVRIGYQSPRDGTEHEVLVLVVPLSGQASVPTDEELLEALAPVLQAPAHFSVHLEKSWTNRDTDQGSLALRVELADREPRRSVDHVAEVLRSIRAVCGDPQGPDLHRDDALTRARVWVASAYPHVHSETLSVTAEQHVSEGEGWSFGLATPEREQFIVQVGFLDGYAGSAHVLRRSRSEVIDSLGP